jgi:hypothetical protein
MAISKSRSIKVTGLTELAKALEYDERAVREALNRALVASAYHIAAGADELVPVDTGNLRATQQVTYSNPKAKNMTVEIVYGGPTVDAESGANYAIIQHEKDFHHPKGGTSKYLEKPFVEETAAWPDRLIQRIRAEYAGGPS